MFHLKNRHQAEAKRENRMHLSTLKHDWSFLRL